MWDFLKNAAGKFVQGTAKYFENRMFIQKLFSMSNEAALLALRTKVHSLDDNGYKEFIGAIYLMIQEAQTVSQQLQSGSYNDYSSSFGDSYEGQLWGTIAHAQEGPSFSAPANSFQMQQMQQYVETLNLIAMYAGQFRAEMPQHLSPVAFLRGTPVDTPPPPAPRASGSAELKQHLANRMAQGASEQELFQILQEIGNAESAEGTVAPERKVQLDGVLHQFGQLVNEQSEEVTDLMSQAERARQIAQDLTPAVASPSLPKVATASRPARPQRASELLGLLKTQLMNENTEGRLGKQEQTTWEQLFNGAIHVQNALAAAKTDTETYKLEREALRPLARQMRAFFLRKHLILARPYFPSRSVTPDPNAVFYSGARDLRQFIAGICQQQQLTLLADTVAENPAETRWNQLRMSAIAIFDFRQYDRAITYSSDPQTAGSIAAVAYELGIAFAIGKPVVIVTRPGQALPFDVDIAPTEFSGEGSDLAVLETSMEMAFYSRQRGGEGGSIGTTVSYLRSRCGSSSNSLLRAAVAAVNGEAERDPIKVQQITGQILRALGDQAPSVIFPAWPGGYPNAQQRFCFHVTAFENSTRIWPKEIKEVVRSACPPSILYKRGDDSTECDIIRAIWHDICRAWCIVTDLTDLNANAVIELGMAHVLGRKTFIITQDGNMGLYPATLSKGRMHVYSRKDAPRYDALRIALQRFFASV